MSTNILEQVGEPDEQEPDGEVRGDGLARGSETKRAPSDRLPLARLARAAGFPTLPATNPPVRQEAKCTCGNPLVGSGAKCRWCARRAYFNFKDQYFIPTKGGSK